MFILNFGIQGVFMRFSAFHYISLILLKLSLLKIPEYGSINRIKILNMAGFSIWERYITFWICQNMPWHSSEYILDSKYVRILNMAGFYICLIQYLAWDHSTSRWVLFERLTYWEPCQRSKMDSFGKIIIYSF